MAALRVWAVETGCWLRFRVVSYHASFVSNKRAGSLCRMLFIDHSVTFSDGVHKRSVGQVTANVVALVTASINSSWSIYQPDHVAPLGSSLTLAITIRSLPH